MYVANCSLKYNPEDFTVVDRVLTSAGNTELVGDPFIAHHCGGLLLDGGVFDEKKVDGKYVVTLVGETPTAYMKAKCSLLCDADKFEMVDGALSLKAVEPSGFDITWDGDTEGLDVVEEQFFKVANNISGVASGADLLGATMIISPYEGNPEITEDIIETITEDELITTDNKVYCLASSYFDGAAALCIALEDGIFEDMNFTKGVWFIGVEETLYTSRLYKE